MANNIEASIRSAVERLNPDVLDAILSKCDDRDKNVYIVQPKSQKKRFARAIGAVAAAVVVVFGGMFAYNAVSNTAVDTLVILDVNPSIEIQVNKKDRVLDAVAMNEDAVAILDNMDLKNTHIDVAVNALIGSMLNHGYIQENANSVLLSVKGADVNKSAALQKDLTQSISMQLDRVQGAVISQSLAEDDEIQKMASENQISYGKAALVQKIIQTNSHLPFADLAKLSVNELNLLVGSKNIQTTGMEAHGSASDVEYIGEELAKQAALDHAGIAANEAERLRVELDVDDGIMVYDIEFYYNRQEYEYEINAKDGSVADFSYEKMGSDEKLESPSPVQSPPQNNNPSAQAGFIGEDAALQIAENHSGVTSYAYLKIEMDKDDGLYIYEIEFYVGDIEYDYEIDAVTGAVLSAEQENERRNH